jgi:hypothetical protein
MLLANWLTETPFDQRARGATWSLCALFLAPLLAAVPAPIRLQFSVTAMATLLFCLQPADRSLAVAPAA